MERYSFRNVSFAYPEQEKEALRNISFSVSDGTNAEAFVQVTYERIIAIV